MTTHAAEAPTTDPQGAPGSQKAPDATEAEEAARATVPHRAAAAALAREHDVVPLHQEFLDDSVSPVTAFAQLCGPDEAGFLLESVPVSGGVARYSYVGHRPVPLEPTGGDPLTALRSHLARSVAPVPGLPPFHGGVVGYLGYEAARHFEDLPLAAGPPPGLPESAFLAADDLVVFDHATRRVLLMTLYRPAHESYDDAVARIVRLNRALRRAPAPAASPAACSPPPRRPTTGRRAGPRTSPRHSSPSGSPAPGSTSRPVTPSRSCSPGGSAGRCAPGRPTCTGTCGPPTPRRTCTT